MTGDAVRGTGDNIGGDAVERATGFRREHWFARLDEAGAADANTAGRIGGWKHPRIVAWLTEAGVDAWWAQHVTVAYEQARGIRAPGQRQDGTFEASVSRSIGLPLVEGLNELVDVVSAELGVDPLSRNVTAKHPTARFKLGGAEFVLASSSPKPSGCSIGLVWGGLPGGDDLAERKERMREWLRRVG